MVRQLLYKIKLHFSSLVSLLKRSWPARLALLGLVGLLIVFGTLLAIKTVGTDQPVDDSACPATPAFTTVLPADKSIEQLGGWQRLRCLPDGTASYVYVDTIESTSIQVTLQPLPEALRDHPEQELKRLADDANYTQQVQSDDDTIVYIGSSSMGPQSAMLIKQNLLINIYAESSIPSQAWQDYVDSLN